MSNTQERQKEVVHTYYSWRGQPLIFVGKSDVPIVTMENYCKWYGIQVVFPDGRVENVHPNVLDELCGNDHFIGDHNYHPELLRRVAKHYGGHADYVSLEASAGRWAMEINEDATYLGRDDD